MAHPGDGPTSVVGEVRAVSLDLWLTLLRSHPSFKARRAALLRTGLGLDVDDAVFGAALRAADRRADDLAETTGHDLALADRLRLTLDALAADGALGASAARTAGAVLGADLDRLTAAQHDLALELPPAPLHPDVPDLLARLAERVPLAVTSNTGMIPAATMRALLAANDLLAPFSVLTFSDEVGAPKPDRRVFDATFDALARAVDGSVRRVDGSVPAVDGSVRPLRRAEVVHVGDNARADVAGARAAGLLGMLVDDLTPTDLALRDLLRATGVVRVALHTLGASRPPADARRDELLGDRLDASAVGVRATDARPAGVRAADASAVGVRDAVPPRDGVAFDAARYSWAKHGDLDAVDALGSRLAAELVARVPALVTDARPPVLPVAYLAVPPACLLLARRVLTELDAARATRGLGPGRVVRVAKDSVTHTDYAASSADARRAELARIGFRLTEDVSDGQVVVVDDVRVTGLAEVTVLRALEVAPGSAGGVVVAYLAAAEPDLAADPAVEARLNHAAVTSVADLVPVVRRGRFALTVRFLKRLLSAPADERATFLTACPPALLDEIAHGARATGAAFCAGYADGLAAVDALREPGRAAVGVGAAS